jgi:hypothetical protein
MRQPPPPAAPVGHPDVPEPAVAPAAPANVARAAAAAPAAPYTGDPSDAEVLAGLRARRDLLGQQLERASERRGELITDVTSTVTGPNAIHEGASQRLRVIDEQIVQLERDIVATDRQIAAAPTAVLAQTEQRVMVHEDHGPDDEDVVAGGGIGFALGLLVMFLARRIRSWRRRGERRPLVDAPREGAPDPRFDRLAHAVDAIAVEVERIGEGQRFVTQLLADSRGRAPELAAAASVDDVGDTRAVPGANR